MSRRSVLLFFVLVFGQSRVDGLKQCVKKTRDSVSDIFSTDSEGLAETVLRESSNASHEEPWSNWLWGDDEESDDEEVTDVYFRPWHWQWVPISEEREELQKNILDFKRFPGYPIIGPLKFGGTPTVGEVVRSAKEYLGIKDHPSYQHVTAANIEVHIPAWILCRRKRSCPDESLRRGSWEKFTDLENENILEATRMLYTGNQSDVFDRVELPESFQDFGLIFNLGVQVEVTIEPKPPFAGKNAHIILDGGCTGKVLYSIARAMTTLFNTDFQLGFLLAPGRITEISDNRRFLASYFHVPHVRPERLTVKVLYWKVQ